MPNALKLNIVVLLLIAGSLAGCSTEKVWIRKDMRDWQQASQARDTPEFSLFLVGDAGKAKKKDKVLMAVRKMAKAHVNDAVIFLGDNLYPDGLHDSEHEHHEKEQKILAAQIDAVKDVTGHVLMVPGNHDWAQGAPDGLENVLRAEKYVESLAGEANVWQPDRGCPGPIEIELAKDIVLLAIDTQWWLHRHEKPDSGCASATNAQFLENVEAAIRRHEGKKIIVAAHHPLYSYGAHGGKYPAYTHLFPLTMAKKNLWIPLPVLGTVAVLARKWRGSIQDIPHPVYTDLQKSLTEIFRKFPDLIYVSGHDHHLEYRKVEDQHYIISGSGSKTRWVGHGKKAVVTTGARGFGRLDFHADGSVELQFFVLRNEEPAELIFRTAVHQHE